LATRLLLTVARLRRVVRRASAFLLLLLLLLLPAGTGMRIVLRVVVVVGGGVVLLVLVATRVFRIGVVVAVASYFRGQAQRQGSGQDHRGQEFLRHAGVPSIEKGTCQPALEIPAPRRGRQFPAKAGFPFKRVESPDMSHDRYESPLVSRNASDQMLHLFSPRHK